MAQITKRQHEKSSAKKPARSPTASPPHPTSRSRPKEPLTSRRQTRVQPSSHGMITRSRAAQFRLSDLPPEIRNHIYSYTTSDDNPKSLSGFRLPPLLSVSKEVRSESLHMFFATNSFKATLRSSWCVRNKHFHGPGYKRHDKAGIVELSLLLHDADVGLPKDAIRFRHIEFCIKCVCCIQPLDIGYLTLSVEDRKPVVKGSAKTIQPETKNSLNLMFAETELVAKRIGARQVFNGFAVDDVVELASCFKHGSALLD